MGRSSIPVVRVLPGIASIPPRGGFSYRVFTTRRTPAGVVERANPKRRHNGIPGEQVGRRDGH